MARTAAGSRCPGLRAAAGQLRAELAEGLTWTWRQPFLRYSAFFAAAVNILLQVLTLGLIVLARHDGAAPAEIGVIVACMGAGGLAGAFAAPWCQRKIPAGLTITGCMWIWTALLALIVAIRTPLWLCPVVMVFGFVGPSWNVSVQTYRMRITPNQLLGRTSSVALQIGWGVIPLGSLLAGFLLQALSPSAAMTVVAAGMAVTAVTATALAPVRRAGRGDQPPPATAAGLGPAARRVQLAAAELGGEGRQVEQVEQGVAPPLPRGPVVEVPEAFVRRVQDRPQHRAFGSLPLWRPALPDPACPRMPAGSPSRIAAAFRAIASPSVPASSTRCIIRTPLWSFIPLASIIHCGCPAFGSMMPTGSDIPARPRRPANIRRRRTGDFRIKNISCIAYLAAERGHS